MGELDLCFRVEGDYWVAVKELTLGSHNLGMHCKSQGALLLLETSLNFLKSNPDQIFGFRILGSDQG